jgi:hypothetical protein
MNSHHDGALKPSERSLAQKVRRNRGVVFVAMEEVEERVASAVRATRLLLTTPSVPHAYQDKYSLVDVATSTAILALLHVLELTGLSYDALLVLERWAADRAVVLQLRVEESCTFDRKEEREIEDDSSFVVRCCFVATFRAHAACAVIACEQYLERDAEFKDGDDCGRLPLELCRDLRIAGCGRPGRNTGTAEALSALFLDDCSRQHAAASKCHP